MVPGTILDCTLYSLKLYRVQFAFLMLIFGLVTLKAASGAPNFEDDVYPVFKKHCLSCHSADKKKADLDLSTVKSIQTGSSGGDIVKAGSPDTSVLFMVMDHHEDFEPMPPRKPKVPDEDLKVVHAWIAGGLIESAGGVSQLRKMNFDLSAGSAQKPVDPAVPVNLPPVPVADTVSPAPIVAMAASPWADVIAASGHEQILLYGKKRAARLEADFVPVADADLLSRKGVDGAIRFEGESLLLDEIPGDFLDGGSGFTISMWIKPDPTMKTQPIFGRESFRLFLEASKTGWKIRGMNRDEANGIVYTGRADGVPRGESTLVTVTCDGKNWEYFYSGKSVIKQPVPETQPGFLKKSKPLFLGGNGIAGPEAGFHGEIEDFRFYRKVLSATEVRGIFQNAQSSFSHIGTLPFPEGAVHDLRFSRNGELLVAAGGKGAYSGKVVIFDVKTGERKAVLGDEQDIVLSADITADHRFVAMGTPANLVKIYSTQSGELLHRIKKHTDWVSTVRFSPDGSQLASGDRNGGIHVWETATGGIVYTLDEHKVKVTALSWRPDGGILASGGEDGKFVLWDMKDGWAIRSAEAHSEKSLSRYTRTTGVLDLDFAKDGRILTAGRDRSLKLWNPDGSKSAEYSGLNELPIKAVFSGDGHHIFSGNLDGSLWIWDTKTFQPIAKMEVGRPKMVSR